MSRRIGFSKFLFLLESLFLNRKYDDADIIPLSSRYYTVIVPISYCSKNKDAYKLSLSTVP